jgi:hypothetical protein
LTVCITSDNNIIVAFKYDTPSDASVSSQMYVLPLYPSTFAKYTNIPIRIASAQNEVTGVSVGATGDGRFLATFQVGAVRYIIPCTFSSSNITVTEGTYVSWSPTSALSRASLAYVGIGDGISFTASRSAGDFYLRNIAISLSTALSLDMIPQFSDIPHKPTTSAVAGQWLKHSASVANGAAFTAPTGGHWACLYLGNTVAAFTAGAMSVTVVSGGGTIATNGSGSTATMYALVWRID